MEKDWIQKAAWKANFLPFYELGWKVLCSVRPKNFQNYRWVPIFFYLKIFFQRENANLILKVGEKTNKDTTFLYHRNDISLNLVIIILFLMKQ